MEGYGMYNSSYYGNEETHFSTEKCHSDQKPGEHFTVEDLLDFSNKEDDIMKDAFFDSIAGNSTDSSTVTAVDSCNSSVSGNDMNFSGNFPEAYFSGDLCVPHNEVAELEWLSNFVEEDTYSTEDQYLNLITGSSISISPTPDSVSRAQLHNPTRPNSSTIQPDTLPAPAKAQRSRRSRAAPCNWSSRLLHLISPSSTPTVAVTQSPTNSSETTNPKTAAFYKRRETNLENSEGRKCLHCASEKTPQWRTGPMGPKTLCNACGVRFKSGRLVPEYRPAASPTFVSTKHSNSHRKVLELRRQREMHGAGSHHQSHTFMGQHSFYGVPDNGDYLIHDCTGLDYRHMMQ